MTVKVMIIWCCIYRTHSVGVVSVPDSDEKEKVYAYRYMLAGGWLGVILVSGHSNNDTS